MALGFKQFCGFGVESQKRVPAEQCAAIRDDAIRKIPSGFEHVEPGLDGGMICDDLAACYQRADGNGDFRTINIVAALEDPAEFAQDGQRYGDQFGCCQR